MDKIIYVLLGLIILAIAVYLIYDARNIATEHFSNGDTNYTTKTIKIVGAVLSILGLLIILDIMM